MLRNVIQFSRGLHAFQIHEVAVMELLEKFVLLLRNLFSKISVLTWWNYLIHSDSINQYRQFVPFESLFLNRLFFFKKNKIYHEFCKSDNVDLFIWS